MSPSPTPVSDREAAVEARIARIRARNEELLRRHQEVEEDRRSAESRDSAMKKQDLSDWSEEGAFQNPFGSRGRGRMRSDKHHHGGAGTRHSIAGRPARQRLGERLHGGEPDHKQQQRSPQESDMPPPDPNYSFLADRLRDVSIDHDFEPPGRGRRRGGTRERSKDFVTKRDVRASEEVNGRNGFPTGPSGVDNDSWRRSERPANSRPQEDFSVRSSRGAHHRTLGEPRRVKAGRDKLVAAPKVEEKVEDKGDVDVSDSQQKQPSPEPVAAAADVASSESHAKEGLQGTINEMDCQAQQESEPEQRPPAVSAQPQESPPHIYDWKNSPSIADWSEEVLKELPDSPEQVSQGVNWDTYPAAAAPATMPQNYVPMAAAAAAYNVSYYPTADTLVSPGPAAHYLPHQTNGGVGGGGGGGGVALTQISQSPHCLPIMSCQPLMGLAQHQQHQMYSQSRQMPSTPPAPSYSSRRPYFNSNHSVTDLVIGRGRGRGASGGWWQNREAQREVTRIPSRFQKHRLPSQQIAKAKSKVRFSLPSHLPCASSSDRPADCHRLTMLASRDFLSGLNAQKLSEKLSTPVRRIDVSDLAELHSTHATGAIDPASDRYIVIHAGSTDAGAIASTTGSGDAEKCSDADATADALCDLVEELLRRVPYLTIIMSTLPPRFDTSSCEATGMSLPNSVRRVMNVQVSTRLYDRDGVVMINNDEVLEWYEEEEKRDKLFHPDGVTLTKEGEEVLERLWVERLRHIVTPVALSSTTSVSATAAKVHEPTKEKEDNAEEIKEKENEERMEKDLK